MTITVRELSRDTRKVGSVSLGSCLSVPKEHGAGKSDRKRTTSGRSVLKFTVKYAEKNACLNTNYCISLAGAPVSVLLADITGRRISERFRGVGRAGH